MSADIAALLAIQLHPDHTQSNKEIKNENRRSLMCLHLCGSLDMYVFVCVCVCILSIEVSLPVHINQADVFGRVISGLPQATFLLLLFCS